MWDSFRIAGTIVTTPAAGGQNTLENINVARNTITQDTGVNKVIPAAGLGVQLELVDSPTAGGTLFALFSDQPLNVYVNGSGTALPCNEALIISASTVIGSLIDQVSVDNLSVAVDANIRYYLVK